MPSDFDASVSSLAASSGALARLVNSRLTERVKAISGTDLDKLSELLLRFLVDQSDTELRMSSLAKRMGVEASSVTRKVQKLEESGLVSRVTDPLDARAWHLRLTEKGRDTLARLDAARRQLIGEAVAQWDEVELAGFVASFEHFLSDLNPSPGEPVD